MKRGQSGLSLVVGVDKPKGVSSHDVVNAVRGIFQEKRVGHTGTLDPLATGVLPICIGPATRLSSLLTSEDKFYRAQVVFGASTATDDSQGKVIHRAPVPAQVYDAAYAQEILHRFLGPQKQLPPVYSAIKVGGKKSYEAARAGNIIDLQPRDIEVFSADLVAIVPQCSAATLGKDTFECAWDVRFHVSKGTYIRSLARDIGRACATYAHIGELRREQTGSLHVDECVSLDMLQTLQMKAALDPVVLLGRRILFLTNDEAARVYNGSAVPAPHQLFELLPLYARNACACTPSICNSCESPLPGEEFSLVADNKLVGIYTFDGEQQLFKPKCVFREGVIRGTYL